jgi:uncharacterized protein YbjT (DUF2867 family)
MTMTSQAGSICASESEINVRTAGQKNLVIVGATGMVGGYALRYALEHSAVGRATTIGRRKVGISHPRLTEVLHQDFADCSARGGAIRSARNDLLPGCVYRGGIGHRAPHDNSGLHDRVRTILHGSSPEAAFAFLSGSGSDPTGRSRMSFARYKGEAENALLATGFASVYIFRPAYIYPVTPRREPDFGYSLLRAPAFRLIFPHQVIRADDLARAMVDVAVRGTEERQGLVLENRDIQAIVE